MNEARPERRLAAILAADVAGYSRLMSADEAGTLDALKSCLSDSVVPLMTGFGGRIFKTTGDGILVEFASAVEAVDCAVKMQRQLAKRNQDRPPGRRIEFRIAINLGDVIVDGGDVFGDGVNIAARLQPFAEPGGICVTHALYEQVVNKVEVPFAEMGLRKLKNIATPVRVFRVDWHSSGAAQAEPAPPFIDDRPSIAVLPFDNLSEDRGLGLLADGLVEDVIAMLARIPGFFVISRGSAFAYRNMSPDVREVGRELGVRYVVQGSVRPAGANVRATAQLADADTGLELWTQHFDADRAGTIDLQDKIAHAIVIELEPELTRAELSSIQRLRPDNLDTWSRYRKAVGAISLKGWNEESAAEAIEELRQITRTDPGFPLAHALLGILIAFAANMSLISDTPEVRREAREASERAIELDPGSSEVIGYAGCAIADLGEDLRGCEMLERAIEIDPSNAQARVALGTAQARLHRLEEGIENLRLGMRLSPRDVRIAFWGMFLANALLNAGRLEEALAEASLAARRDGRLYTARLVAARTLVKLGRNDDARMALAEALRIRPNMTLAEVEKFFGAQATEDLKPLWQAG
jgi:adenylate cyclase